ncbi:type IV toxin-antitoxin system AbiEi family antitoxin [Glaciibacter superstes]|uniref:type IV toxin-antitoxin system AbiEi family antitoxin n=1 Tax=Glaciibacter superstes TaxID=501023 RepID=UPI0003B482D9|nr:type IV toxin-antitoxin system AbiEi family antitoxin [Glaciibacter superstes]
MTYRLPSVLTTADLPLAELGSARLDGEVFSLGDGWCPIDEIEGQEMRARAAGLLVPSRAIAECLTAAWIYGACQEPTRHQFFVSPHARVAVHTSARYLLRELRCAPTDLQNLGGTRVTTPVRTIVDLARNESVPDDRAILAMATLLARRWPGVTDDIDGRTQQGTQRSRAMARARLSAAMIAAGRMPSPNGEPGASCR